MFVKDTILLIIFPDWQNNNDQMYSCQRDQCPTQLRVPIKPLGPSQHYLIEALSGVCNYVPIPPRALVSQTANGNFSSLVLSGVLTSRRKMFSKSY